MSKHIYLTTLGVVTMLPALVLGSVGLLFRVTPWEFPEHWMDTMLSSSMGRWLLSPGIILGGLLVSLSLNVPRVCRVGGQCVDDRWLFSLSVARRPGPLLIVLAAGGLATFILIYVAVENLFADRASSKTHSPAGFLTSPRN